MECQHHLMQQSIDYLTESNLKLQFQHARLKRALKTLKERQALLSTVHDDLIAKADRARKVALQSAMIKNAINSGDLSEMLSIRQKILG